MSEEIDPNLTDKLQFQLNHEKQIIESDNPSIYLRDRGAGFGEAHVEYFSLYWNGRVIPVSARWQARDFGKNSDGQWVSEVHWTIQRLGSPDYGAHGGRGEPYIFTSHDEFIVAANIAFKALNVYGGVFNNPELNLLPVFKRISVTLSDDLRARMYGDRN